MKFKMWRGLTGFRRKLSRAAVWWKKLFGYLRETREGPSASNRRSSSDRLNKETNRSFWLLVPGKESAVHSPLLPFRASLFLFLTFFFGLREFRFLAARTPSWHRADFGADITFPWTVPCAVLGRGRLFLSFDRTICELGSFCVIYDRGHCESLRRFCRCWESSFVR